VEDSIPKPKALTELTPLQYQFPEGVVVEDVR
jgi:hypothetical protein